MNEDGASTTETLRPEEESVVEMGSNDTGEGGRRGVGGVQNLLPDSVQKGASRAHHV